MKAGYGKTVRPVCAADGGKLFIGRLLRPDMGGVAGATQQLLCAPNIEEGLMEPRRIAFRSSRGIPGIPVLSKPTGKPSVRCVDFRDPSTQEIKLRPDGWKKAGSRSPDPSVISSIICSSLPLCRDEAWRAYRVP
jgi:hypothetical protein